MPETNILPCLICGKELTQACGDMSEQDIRLYGYVANQPGNGTAFESRGHYGSDHFDAMYDDAKWEIAVCSECLTTRLERTRVIVRTKAAALPWADYCDHERRVLFGEHPHDSTEKT